MRALKGQMRADARGMERGRVSKARKKLVTEIQLSIN